MDEKPDQRPTSQQKGGLVRKERLTPARRSEIAARAAQARWNRGPGNLNLANIEDFQMSSDVIDAADILMTELSEQAAVLSQSGVNALSNGYLSEARLIINAIEETQALRDRAEQLKTDIAELYSSLVPRSPETSSEVLLESLGNEGRKQDRTDPVLMNKKRKQILLALEQLHHIRLNRRSAAVYRSENGGINVVCTMSKWYAKNDNYWYAYHPHQNEFLANASEGYFVLGMMDLDVAVELPVNIIHGNLSKLNTTTTPDGRSYWHIHITRSDNGELWLQRARGEPPLSLNRYIVEVTVS